MRAAMSVVPPGAAGTISVIGLLGYGDLCGRAARAGGEEQGNEFAAMEFRHDHGLR